MTTPSTFGELLRHLRKRAGMTQGELAAATGYSASYISVLEKGQRRPDPRIAAEHFAPALAATSDARLLARLIALAKGVSDDPGKSDAQATPPIPPVAPVHGAPPPVKLLGRDAEIDAICQRLMNHAGRLLTLTGPPGIGKTSSALAVAHALAPFHADGACVVWLGAVNESDLVAPAIASALGIVEDDRPPQERLIAHLRRRELLLLLDNFEHMTPAAPLVAELLAACPRLRVLVTSRARLRLRAEQSTPIRPLDRQSAVELFLAHMRTRDRRAAPSPTQRETIAEICRLLDDLPLAIEVIAAQAPDAPLDELLGHLRDRRLDLLGGRGAGVRSDERTLMAALQRSYALLTPAEQGTLHMLGVFDGGVGLDALEWLGCDLRTVQALADKSLARLESAGDTRRVLLLETVREFALHLLRERGEMAAAQRQRLNWCVALAEEAESQLHSVGQTRWLQRLEPDRYNFYAAFRDAMDAGALADAIRILVALRHFWVARSHLAEIAPWLTLLLAATEGAELDARLLVRLLNCAGTIAFYRAEYAEAQAHFAAALARAEEVGDRQGVAYALDGLGAEAANRGDLSFARACSLASLENSTASNDGGQWLAGITLMNLGEIARSEGDLAAAARYYGESLQRLQLAGDPFFIAVALINLGQVALHQGDLAQAETVLRQSLAAGLQAESVQVVAPALEKLAGVLAMGEDERAGRLFGLAQGMRQSSGVSVQPVDRADYERLAERVQPFMQAQEYADAVSLGARLQWPAIHTWVAAMI